MNEGSQARDPATLLEEVKLLVEGFIGHDALLSHVSTDAVTMALEDFALPLAADCSMEWLATAVRRPSWDDRSPQPSRP
jgi:hypothetical protein